MAFADIKESKDERTTQKRAAVELQPFKSGEMSGAGQTLVRKGQHLDVDAILARSFRDVKAIGFAEQ